MRATIKREGAATSLPLGPAAAAALSGQAEADVIVLRQGVLLVAAPGALSEIAAGREGGARPASGALAPSVASALRAPPWLAQLSTEEMALLRKLSGVKFEERIVPDIDRLLSAAEKKVLALLTGRKLVSIFKNAKYPKGVYNLSPVAYAAGAHPQELKLAQQAVPISNSGQAAGAPASPSQPVSSRGGPASSPSAGASPPVPVSARQLSINTVDHLAALGYMVLDNENDAKRVMPEITSRLKNDNVKGVRGFDKRYYVLRRSFLMEYEGPLLALVDLGPATPEELAGKLNLTSEAVRVLLMILGDEGEVIEKRRGNWVRA
ncbi:MAG: helix-turn-helix transcriptional regulator [Candidatus Micrarchaeota archaeon]|nr:helix-turn-helix transcriptional regulator [Candidatus Micrarchaeota archaeon]